MFGKILTFVLAMSFIPISVLAFDDKEDKVATALKKYQKTGEIENCVWIRRIHSTKVIDDFNILFRMKGNKAYLNKLPRRCPRLGFEKSFSYRLHSSQLCNVDTITVIDSSGIIHGPTCGLGKFVQYKKIPKEKQAESK